MCLTLHECGHKQKPAQYQLTKVCAQQGQGSFFSFGLVLAPHWHTLHLVGFGTTAHEPRLWIPLHGDLILKATTGLLQTAPWWQVSPV